MDLFAYYAPIIGLLFFFLVFIGITISVMRPGAKNRLEELSRIPLKENNNG